LRERICWKTISKGAASLVDQSFVSGTRFATTILIGSVCGAAELGVYAIGFSMVMALQAFQMSLFSRPYTIFSNQKEGREQQEFAGSVLLHFAAFSLLTSLVLAAIVGVLYVLRVESSITPIFVTLSMGAPFILLREHARQFCFAHLKVATATAVDGTATVIQLVGLGWLAWTGRLSAVSALVTMIIGCSAAGSLWLWTDRKTIRFSLARIASDFRKQWSIGKWDCASELTFAAQIQGITWLIAFWMDNAAVGIYAACMMVMQIFNPVLLAMGCFLVPKTAQAYAKRGVAGMHAIVRNTTFGIGVATTVFACFTVLWVTEALEFLYRGQGFDIPDIVVTILSISLIADVLGMGPVYGLWVMERQQAEFRVCVASFIATFGTAFLLVPSIGLTGVAWSFFVGRLVMTIGHWLTYHHASLEVGGAVVGRRQKSVVSS
jgi:O-antigen/teichoic acid export membrane protein